MRGFVIVGRALDSMATGTGSPPRRRANRRLRWSAKALALLLIVGVVACAASAAQAATPTGSHVFTGDAYDNEMGVIEVDSHTRPHADGIIAVLIGLRASDGPEQLTAPLGSTNGSFIDASMVYGSAD
jgi:hypothetical protein